MQNITYSHIPYFLSLISFNLYTKVEYFSIYISLIYIFTPYKKEKIDIRYFYKNILISKITSFVITKNMLLVVTNMFVL